MKTWFCLTLGTFLVGVMVTSPASAADARLGGMRLLVGYKHQPLQGFDSIVGKIEKEGGLRINYEIGHVPKPGAPRFGGSFSDRPKLTPKDKVRWYREQVVNGQAVHIAYRKDNVLMVSYPKKGMNFSVTIRSTDEMAEALLMILTYPDPVAGDGRKEATPKKKRSKEN
ncbi:MAG: hypothetical protein IH991_25910 [Planctomycetes bacterium]|nr:hypothetical protein [Planctomycetota bacterium]